VINSDVDILQGCYLPLYCYLLSHQYREIQVVGRVMSQGGMQSHTSLWCSPDLVKTKTNTNTPKSKLRDQDRVKTSIIRIKKRLITDTDLKLTSLELTSLVMLPLLRIKYQCCSFLLRHPVL